MNHPRFFSPYDQPMWDSISNQEMQLQKCSKCGEFRYPPGPACPNCLSTESSWEKISGRGELLSWTVFHRQYLPAYPVPNIVVAVRLEEGPIVVSNIGLSERDRLFVGAPVSIIYTEHPDGYLINSFISWRLSDKQRRGRREGDTMPSDISLRVR